MMLDKCTKTLYQPINNDFAFTCVSWLSKHKTLFIITLIVGFFKFLSFVHNKIGLNILDSTALAMAFPFIVLTILFMLWNMVVFFKYQEYLKTQLPNHQKYIRKSVTEQRNNIFKREFLSIKELFLARKLKSEALQLFLNIRTTHFQLEKI